MFKKDDQSLWTALRAGSEKAFVEIWTRYYIRFCLDAQSRLGNSHDAEDVVQEVFKGIWHKAIKKHLPEEVDMDAYLHTILYNACNFHFRNKKKNPVEYRPEDELPVEGVLHDPFSSKEIIRIINDTIAGLTPAQRSAFELKILNVRNKDIARQTGKSPRTITNQLAAARKILRNKLPFLLGD
ncbi:RNA polymerase sigma factor, sigma-70 family [Chitinophaga rupis]|uniref:RNA polymerase sigma factor, sigma-70 family n=1 Tax=Chitinophaga rupis TaxID=573321 RepID=A0A1H7XXE7_9BACT|nr:sigma-70 family RNA polymerase sigma factor [Chitinophaga rupis]SEM38383.1 RNA polymerase sigma factor, sigma-70 family [Chitinophaga rupis]